MDTGSSSQTIHSSGDSSGTRSTGSKGSKHSAKVEIDLTKDNAASPVDLECLIQKERFEKIFDELIYKTKLAICLPMLMEDRKILSESLTSHDLDDLTFIFQQYDNPLISSSLLNVATIEDIKMGDVSLRNRLNPELGHLLCILCSYPTLKQPVEKIIDKIKREYVDNSDEISEPTPMVEFLLLIEKYVDSMVEQMQKTAAEELGEKFRVKHLEQSNGRLTADIADLNKTLSTEKKTFDDIMTQKKALIDQLEAEIQMYNSTSEEKIRKQVLLSNIKMVKMARNHEVRYEVLKGAEIETREGYNNLLYNHLAYEKAQRARRFKVETQLQSWLTKYDTEMADKQFELDKLKWMFEDETRLVEKFSKKLAEQEVTWAPLMKEKHDEYHEEMTRKQKEFREVHAARVLQTAWKQVLINRAEKRKLKRIWKKMKAEQDRLQKIADAKELKERKEAEKREKEAKKKKK